MLKNHTNKKGLILVYLSYQMSFYSTFVYSLYFKDEDELEEASDEVCSILTLLLLGCFSVVQLLEKRSLYLIESTNDGDG